MHLYYFLIVLFINLNVSNSLVAEPTVPWPATLSIAKPEPDECIKKIKAGSFDLKCDGLLFLLHVPSCLQLASAMMTPELFRMQELPAGMRGIS